MNFTESLTVLTELTKFGINLGLERITSLLDFLGNPQDRLNCIHIGGTNGKGSTTAMLSAVLTAAGYKVGTYTSPHLISYTERFVIDGRPIPENEFASLLEELVPVFSRVREKTGESPSEFEVLTALAFVWFYRNGVDVAVMEVGLGGDIDSTNVIKKPLLSIITNVTLDHPDYLGGNVAEIAGHKSGIIKQGCPVITASEDGTVINIIRSKADRLQAPFHLVSSECAWQELHSGIDGQRFNLIVKSPGTSLEKEYQDIYLPLSGPHQMKNAATAVLALEVLGKTGWRVSEEAVRLGLSRVAWPGRLELLKREPYIVIDGAHNPAGMETLACWLAAQRDKVRKVILVIGMLADKDRAASVAYIEPLVDKIIITKPHSPRAGNWQEMSSYFTDTGRVVLVIEDLPDALSAALLSADKSDLVLVTGSLYLIGEARRLLLTGRF